MEIKLFTLPITSESFLSFLFISVVSTVLISNSQNWNANYKAQGHFLIYIFYIYSHIFMCWWRLLFCYSSSNFDTYLTGIYQTCYTAQHKMRGCLIWHCIGTLWFPLSAGINNEAGCVWSTAFSVRRDSLSVCSWHFLFFLSFLLLLVGFIWSCSTSAVVVLVVED